MEVQTKCCVRPGSLSVRAFKFEFEIVRDCVGRCCEAVIFSYTSKSFAIKR